MNLFRIVVIAVLIFAHSSVVAQSRNIKIDDAPVLRHRIKYRAERFEIMPTFTLSFHDAYVQNLIVGLDLNYHITNWISAGLNFGYGFKRKKNLLNQIDTTLNKTTEVAHLGLMLLANIQFVPLSGKFMAFNKLLINYDLHVIVGGGLVQLKSNGDLLGSKFTFAPVIGVGFRVFFTQYLGLNIEFRDVIVRQALNVTRTASFSKSFVNHFMFTLGISVFLPVETKMER